MVDVTTRREQLQRISKYFNTFFDTYINLELQLEDTRAELRDVRRENSVLLDRVKEDASRNERLEAINRVLMHRLGKVEGSVSLLRGAVDTISGESARAVRGVNVEATDTRVDELLRRLEEELSTSK